MQRYQICPAEMSIVEIKGGIKTTKGFASQKIVSDFEVLCMKIGTQIQVFTKKTPLYSIYGNVGSICENTLISKL